MIIDWTAASLYGSGDMYGDAQGAHPIFVWSGGSAATPQSAGKTKLYKTIGVVHELDNSNFMMNTSTGLV